MEEKLLAYVDSFDAITILINKNAFNNQKRFYLVYNGKKTNLEILDCYEEYSFYKAIVRFVPFIELYKEYMIEDEMGNTCILQSGSVVRSSEFEQRYKYDGKLGFEYSKKKTIFRIWSPVAKEVILELIHNNKKEKLHLHYTDKGVWMIEVNGDIEGYGYIYYVRVYNKLVKINDPYAISSAANGKYNYVIDMDKLYKMKYDKPKFSGNYVDAVIYEASIRDFTSKLKTPNKGTFLGMLECELNLDYIVDLGATHLQLLPTFDFGGVDDIKKSSEYNWGYNPEQYFVPCGWYSKNPNDPYSRINELLELIDQCHKRGLRVVMDVVFNHVYKCELFAFDHLVPGYFYRVEADGRLSNATGCGNVIATEKYMASRFVKDVLEYYAKYFNVTGFRFDLMGLLDINTLNNSYEALKQIDDVIMVYGEGWNMINPLPDDQRPHMYNHSKIPQYAFFNDRYRDFVRGSQWNKTAGYAFGDGKSLYDLGKLLAGSCIDYYKFNEPTQTVNYVECHDNYTMYDYGKYCQNEDEEALKGACTLALQMIIISEGIPFIHGGQEFFRTKMGVENSYNSKDSINAIDHKRCKQYQDNVNAIKDLISIRKEYDVFRLATKDEIEDRVHALDGIINNHTSGALMEMPGFDLFVIVKNDNSVTEIDIHSSKMIYNGRQKCDITLPKYTLDEPGVYIIRREKKNAVRW